MALRIYVLVDAETASEWSTRACSEINGCDWWSSAEWAGVDEDAPVVGRLAGVQPVVQGDAVAVDYGELGLVNIEPCTREDLEVYAEEGTVPRDLLRRAQSGFVITLFGVTGDASDILCAAYHAIGIGLSNDGLVSTPSKRWWDARAGTWLPAFPIGFG